MVPPRGFDDWLSTLVQHGMGSRFRTDVAGQLRVVAGTGAGGVVLCAGRLSLPYVDWIQDGMSMSSRLLLHIGNQTIAALVKPHFSTDIRIATHVQDLSSFLSDIEEHRFDLILADVDEYGPETMSVVAGRVAEQGLLVALGCRDALSDFIDRLGNTHFHCALGGSGHAAAFTRKGLQHRASRRGGRRGRAV